MHQVRRIEIASTRVLSFGRIYRYHGEVGDVLIGRILEVGQRRWKVQTNTKLDSILMLSSVNLPGGELVHMLKCTTRFVMWKWINLFASY